MLIKDVGGEIKSTSLLGFFYPRGERPNGNTFTCLAFGNYVRTALRSITAGENGQMPPAGARGSEGIGQEADDGG